MFSLIPQLPILNVTKMTTPDDFKNLRELILFESETFPQFTPNTDRWTEYGLDAESYDTRIMIEHGENEVDVFVAGSHLVESSNGKRAIITAISGIAEGNLQEVHAALMVPVIGAKI